MYEIPARICPACGDLVWNDQPSVTDNGKAYHAECYKWLEARVETLTRHARKVRQRVICRDFLLTKAVSASG
jgi:hypothetical protein